MKSPIVFGLIGLLTGVLTLAVISITNAGLYSPGLLFASGLGLGIWLAQRGANERIPQGLVLAALLVVAFGYHVLVWLLLAVQGVVGFLGSSQTTLPIGYWLGLLLVSVAAAFILWLSLRLLLTKVKVTMLWWMVATSLMVCGLTIVVDNLAVYHYGFSLHSEQRAWANWFVLFLAGNTAMSFLYGVGVREVTKKGSERLSAAT